LLPIGTVNTAPDNLKNLASTAAILHNLPVKLFIAQVEAESNFQTEATSPVGALGIAQIMPTTAQSWRVDPHDPLASLDVMAAKMAEYWHTYQAQGHDKYIAYQLALSAYNAGPGRVAQYKGVPPYEETRNYVRKIMMQAEF
jgi:soluble lytic murein transglycosylase-like protein